MKQEISEKQINQEQSKEKIKCVLFARYSIIPWLFFLFHFILPLPVSFCQRY
jgi:hypothetical protein